MRDQEEEQPEAAAAEQQRSAYQAGAEKEGTLMYEESPGRWLSNWLSLKEGRLYLFGSRTVRRSGPLLCPSSSGVIGLKLNDFYVRTLSHTHRRTPGRTE